MSPKSTFDGGNLVDLKENPAPEDVKDLEKLPKKENPNRIENHAFLTEMTISKPLKLENKKERKKILFFEENEFISWIKYVVLTFGEVADANKGSNPPQAMIKLSANCEIKCTVLTTKIAFSPLLTKSKTDLVEWDLQTWISVSRENKTSDNNLWWM